MPRVRKGAARSRKHKKTLKSTRGYIGAASRRYRVAREAILRAAQYATVGRKLKKRDFRRLWITRISAACRQRGITYSRFMHALVEKHMTVNRKVLADLAVSDPAAFDKVVAVATSQAPPAAERKPAKAPVKEAKPDQAQPKPKAKPEPKPKAKAEPKPKAEAKEAPKPTKKAAGKAPARKKAAAKPKAAKKAPAKKRPKSGASDA